jgi:hypothetical protein
MDRRAGLHADEKVLGPRFDAPPWSLLYLKHQRDGPFWRDRVRPLKEITIPSFLIGGLLDGYRDNVTDMLMQSSGPVKAIIGPWNHTFPNDAVPGPQIEWRNEAVRWFDHWLKGRDTGVEHDPRLVIYMQHWHPPDPSLENVPGEWRREDVWPPKDARASTLFLQPNHLLAENAAKEDTHQLEVCAVHRRGSGILVGRVVERCASGGRVQPGVRFGAVARGSGYSGPPACFVAGVGHCAPGGLVRAACRMSRRMERSRRLPELGLTVRSGIR